MPRSLGNICGVELMHAGTGRFGTRWLRRFKALAKIAHDAGLAIRGLQPAIAHGTWNGLNSCGIAALPLCLDQATLACPPVQPVS